MIRNLNQRDFLEVVEIWKAKTPHAIIPCHPTEVVETKLEMLRETSHFH